ncbi:MAG: EAL domain-containing protein, partial [Lachnospiraceae bacterium]|nr:EAL domain-containing protein [Lachnospiraceae bacterium]
MNIKFQICGLIILLVILLLSTFQRRIKLYSELMFMSILSTAILSVLLDIISIVAITNRDSISKFALDTICKIYPISLILMATSCLIYTLYDSFSHNIKLYRRYQVITLSLLSVAAILVAILPINYHIDGEIIYTYGPAINCTYVSAMLCILMILYLVTIASKRMNPLRRMSMRIWILIWVMCAGIQFVFNELLLVGFGSALGVMVIYALFENPVENIDRQTGVFNASALNSYMTERYNWDKTFSTLTIFINHRSDKNVESYENALLTIAVTNYLSNFKNARVFRNSTFGFTMTFENKEDLAEAFETIRMRFKRQWDYNPKHDPPVRITPVYFVMEDSSVAESANEINAMLNRQMNSKNTYLEEHVITVDAEQIAETREFNIIKEEIQDAVNDDRIVVYYQPIYSTLEDKFVSAEALVRMVDKDGKLVSPGRFIPVAEATGQIKELGNIIFKKSCKFVHNNRIAEHGLHYIEVNLSVVQCEKKNIAEELKQITKHYDIKPEQISLELTESSTIHSKSRVISNMQKLVDYGFQFCLDDFGSGEANLNYVIDMPVDIVKFDMDLTQSYFVNERANKVMTTIVNMAHDMGLRCVSEGVETEEQFLAMKKLGIDYIQGYYFSRPLPGDEFIKLVDKKNR